MNQLIFVTQIKFFVILAVLRRSVLRVSSPISASLRPRYTAFEEMSQQWQAIGNTVSDLTGPRFAPQTSRSRNEHVTAPFIKAYEPGIMQHASAQFQSYHHQALLEIAFFVSRSYHVLSFAGPRCKISVVCHGAPQRSVISEIPYFF